MGDEDSGSNVNPGGQGDGDAAAAGEVGSDATGETPASFSWRGQLPEDFQTHPSLASYPDTPEGLVNLAKSHNSAQQMIGKLTGDRKPLWIPGDNASPEEVAEFKRALGVPETPDGYSIDLGELPEGFIYSKDDQKAMLAKAHELGVPKDATEKLFKFVVGLQVGKFKMAREKADADFAQAEAGLKEKWGAAYGEKLALANRVADSFLDQESLAFMAASGLDNHPGYVRMMATLGGLLSEDHFKPGDTPGKGGSFKETMTPAEANRRIGEIFQDPAYLDASHPNHERLVDEFIKCNAAVAATAQ